MAKDADVSKSASAKALDSILENIKTTLKKKEGKIALPGFGTFSKVKRKARKGVNPRTGEKITIKARNAVKFQAAKALKDAM
jgi:DNA-binding protein HU-beta